MEENPMIPAVRDVTAKVIAYLDLLSASCSMGLTPETFMQKIYIMQLREAVISGARSVMNELQKGGPTV